jgi:hypothetical protein
LVLSLARATVEEVATMRWLLPAAVLLAGCSEPRWALWEVRNDAAKRLRAGSSVRSARRSAIGPSVRKPRTWRLQGLNRDLARLGVHARETYHAATFRCSPRGRMSAAQRARCDRGLMYSKRSLRLAERRRSQVVRQRTANPLFGGSNPPGASSPPRLRYLRPPAGGGRRGRQYWRVAELPPRWPYSAR